MNIELRRLLRSNAPRILCASAGAYALLGGLVSFCGWLSENDRLKDWWDTGITMKANTAIAAILMGSVLVLHALLPTFRRTITLLASPVAAIGALTLFEHVFDINLGIDTFLFDE